MSVTDYDKIRLRAFQIWEAEGRPEGRDLEHWQRAEFELSLTPLPKRANPSPAGEGPKSKVTAAKKPVAVKATQTAAPKKAAKATTSKRG